MEIRRACSVCGGQVRLMLRQWSRVTIGKKKKPRLKKGEWWWCDQCRGVVLCRVSRRGEWLCD